MASAAIPPSALSDTAAIRLFCLPYAGGGAAVYHRWRRVMPGWLDLVPLTLPGHDGRLHEPAYTDLRALAGALASEIEPVLDRPFALLGCSMGAWLAFEMAHELRRRAGTRNVRSLELLIIAACAAPHTRATESPAHLLPDDAFVATVERRYGGMPAAVRDSPELLKLLLPSLRADLQMVETYQPMQQPLLETSIFALGGTEDAVVSPAQLGEWQNYTASEFSLRFFPGGHFFLFRSGLGANSGTSALSQEVSPAWRAIVERLERCSSQTPVEQHPPR